MRRPTATRPAVLPRRPVLRPRSRLVLPVLRLVPFPAGRLVPRRTGRGGIAGSATTTTPRRTGQQDQTVRARGAHSPHMQAGLALPWAASPAGTGQDSGGTGMRSAPRWSGSPSSASGLAAATGRTGQDTKTATVVVDTARTATATSGTAGRTPARKEHRHEPAPALRPRRRP